MKIRTTLLLLIISLTSASIIVTAFVATLNFTKTIRSAVLEDLNQQAINMLDKLNRVMFERVGDIHFLSIDRILGNPNLTLTEKVDYLRSMEKAYKAYGSISIYNMKGIKIGDTRNVLIGTNASQMPFFEHAIRGEIYYDKVPVLSPSLDEYVLDFSAPIYDNKNKINGVVVTAYPLNKLNSVLNGAIQTDLVASNGLLIYSNYDKQSIFQKNLNNSQIIRMLRDPTNTMNNTVENRMGVDFIVLGIHQTQGYLDYKGSGWYLIVGNDARDLFGVVLSDIKLLFLAASIIIGIAILVAFLFSGKISKYVNELRIYTRLVSEGNYSVKIDAMRIKSDELKELASSFDTMRLNVKHVNENLNAIVTEKIKDLQNVNNELKLKEIDLNIANEELKAADQAKEEFMSMVSHELKTPLAPMKLYVEMLLKSTSSFGNITEKQKKALQIIHNNVLRLEMLVGDILDVYKLDIGRLRLKKTKIECEELVNQIVAELMPLTKEKRIKLGTDIRTSGTINCDPRRISQVISNLVKNSIDFVPQDTGSITIRVEEERTEKEDKQEKGISLSDSDSTTGHKTSDGGNHKVVFTIEDNGPGMHGVDTDGLFKKFYQMDTTATREHGGTGLGLAISRGIIESHGGRIWLDKTYTTGTSIKFTLPREDVI
ncbi:MAG TPA: ATP-binding protein [Candidatus Nitrosopolaris sp.]|nr:ATP-binding protein [Candidatus Nitrosopolaris sp.]